MRKLIVTFLIVMFCGAAHAQEDTETFAVVWEWTTGEREQVNDNLGAQAAQLLELWKKGVVENVYLNTDAKFTDDQQMPNVVFFINAENEDKAKDTLNDMVFVEKSIAKYTLYPVGTLWLIRHEDLQKIMKDDQQKAE